MSDPAVGAHMEQYEPHPLVSLVTACFSVILWFLAWVKTTIGFVTITLPVWIYAVLSWSLTLRLDFPSLVTIFILGIFAAFYFVRFRYLNKYEELKEPPLGKPDVTELHPDVQADDQPTNFHGYLDEFLAAVRIFGFLEKPVFHELARHLQTRRLIAGDSLALDQDQNFYCVVEGLVQVYAPTGRPADEVEGDAWAAEEMNGYQLLNEVGSGGTLSSLFTILSLFTEDVKLAWQEGSSEEGSATDGAESLSRGPSQSPLTRTKLSKRVRTNSDVSQLDLRSPVTGPTTKLPGSSRNLTESPVTFVAGRGRRSTESPMLGAYPATPQTPAFPSQATTPSTPRTPGSEYTYSGKPPKGRQNTLTAAAVRRGMVARASQDSTLAVIPAEAFRRLTKKFPKASAHIIQVILTRFTRVTFNAAHKYLGLTTEVLRAEKAINDIACHPLPAEFYEGGGMHNLRNKFSPETSEGRTDDEDDTMTSASTIGLDSEEDYFGTEAKGSPIEALTPGSGLRRRSPSRGSSSFADSRGVSVASAPRAPIPAGPGLSFGNRNFSHTQITAGDLLSSTTTAVDSALDTYRPRVRSSLKTPNPSKNSPVFPTPVRKAARLPTAVSNGTLLAPIAALPAPDINLRDEVMACIAKSIGLIQPPISTSPSTDTSPVIVPYDGQSGNSATSRRPGVFQNSFSSLSFLETAEDTASTMTGASSLLQNQPYATGLDNEVEILCFAAGTSLVRAGERNAGLFYVIDGFLDVSIPIEDAQAPQNKPSDSPSQPPKSGSNASLSGHHRQGSASQGVRWSDGAQPRPKFTSTTSTRSIVVPKASRHLFTVKPGGIAGYLASLTGTASYVDIKAKVDTYVGFLPHHAMERLIERRPIVLLTLSKRLISLLSPIVLHIDSSLDWMQVNTSQVLWRPGDASDSFYIVINGRLRELADGDGGIVGEYGQGDTVGELDVITQSNRTTTLHAIRDTELARMPKTLFNAISVRHPQATVQLLRMIASRVRRDAQPSLTKNPSKVSGRNNFNLKTVAILPSSRNVPVAEFAKKLHTALEEIGASTSYLNHASMMSNVGRHAFTRMGKLKIAGWLAEQEQRHRIVLYVADSPVSAPWTQTCIRQADYIMVVGLGDDPAVGEYERLLLTTKTTARKELVLLHPDRSVTSGSTREWLKIRPWVHAHLHIELPGIVPPPMPPVPEDPAAVKAIKEIRNKIGTEIRKYRGFNATARSRRPDHLSDFARLARRLCGKSIGLVLGGGGARGVAHLGILRAFEERSIPIDHIGGTSIGAFVGGLYAVDGNVIASGARLKSFSARMANIWRLLSDVTWPVVAYTTGHEFNRGIYKAYGAQHIEDMWLPYFCNTTNILTSRMEIHDTGYAWRYIRASMTLVGLLPPLCDNGNMLVDGGYLDNLPVSTMKVMGPSNIFAVDVGSIDDNSPRNFGDTVSGFWILLNRWNPFSSVRNIPPITEIQSRLAYVSSTSSLEEAKNTPGCFYIQPPVQAYGTMQFGKFDEIVEVGYKHGLDVLEQLTEEGSLPSGFEDEFRVMEKSKKRKGRSLRRNSV